MVTVWVVPLETRRMDLIAGGSVLLIATPSSQWGLMRSMSMTEVVRGEGESEVERKTVGSSACFRDTCNCGLSLAV